MAQDSLRAGAELTFLLLACIIFFSYTTQAITGFGSTVIALALGAQIYPIPALLPVLVALNFPLCLYFVVRHNQAIEHSLLWKEILPWMSAGVIVGLGILATFPVPALRPGLGALIVVIAVREAIRILSAAKSGEAIHPAAFRFWTFASGITHGIYASGGPLLVYAMSKRGLSAANFRSTMMAVWLFFNVFLLAWYAVTGKWSMETTRAVIFLLPVIPAGILAGEFLHHRIPVRAFWILVQAVLFVSGVSFLAQS